MMSRYELGPHTLLPTLPSTPNFADVRTNISKSNKEARVITPGSVLLAFPGVNPKYALAIMDKYLPIVLKVSVIMLI